MALAQIVHDHVAHRLAPDLVAVHQLFDAQLPQGELEGTNRGRGILGEDTHGPQPQVEVDLLLSVAGVHPALGIDELHAVADGDVADPSALAGQQGGDPRRGDLRILARARRPGGGQLVQARESVRVSDLGHHRGEMPVRAGEHPRQSRTDDVSADQHEQPGGQVFPVMRR
ncbi:hypothetical protein ACH4D3_37420 [Streptomyces sp. NPDC018026]|uniref:hypothetical protein n=1 Tax=Streptomyces sp. NPDC018026 TaxID=3365031 RepID=UPI0037B59389